MISTIGGAKILVNVYKIAIDAMEKWTAMMEAMNSTVVSLCA